MVAGNLKFEIIYDIIRIFKLFKFQQSLNVCVYVQLKFVFYSCSYGLKLKLNPLATFWVLAFGFVSVIEVVIIWW
jgi:hypothetical protein